MWVRTLAVPMSHMLRSTWKKARYYSCSKRANALLSCVLSNIGDLLKNVSWWKNKMAGDLNLLSYLCLYTMLIMPIGCTHCLSYILLLKEMLLTQLVSQLWTLLPQPSNSSIFAIVTNCNSNSIGLYCSELTWLVLKCFFLRCREMSTSLMIEGTCGLVLQINK